MVDGAGRVLGSAACEASATGYRQLLLWMRRQGELTQVGVEGTGTYGAGVCRYLVGAGVPVVAVDRPDRRLRRQRGKSDSIDAEAAARAVLAGMATVVPCVGSPRAVDGSSTAAGRTASPVTRPGILGHGR